VELRKTFADQSALHFRLRAAATLIGIPETTLRGYTDTPELRVMRASDLNPKAPSVRIFTPESLFKIALWRRTNNLVKIPKGVRPTVITVDLIKGGVGKTTTAVELALHLQLMGLRCLLVDLDIQGNATQMMGYEPDLTVDEAAQYSLTEEAIVVDTMATVIIPYIERSRSQTRSASDLDPVEVKKPFGEDGPHLLPADAFLGNMEQALQAAYGGREVYLKRLLDDSAAGKVPWFDVRQYDVVIFDCAPSVSFTTSAALAAADIVLAPIRLDSFSVKGLSKLHSELSALASEYGIHPELAILPTHYASQLTRMSRMQAQLQPYHDRLLDCVISHTEELPRSLDNYTPLSLQRPTSQTCAEYHALAEIMKHKVVSRRTAA